MLTPEDIALVRAVIREELIRSLHPSARRAEPTPLPANDLLHPDAPQPPTAA